MQSLLLGLFNLYLSERGRLVQQVFHYVVNQKRKIKFNKYTNEKEGINLPLSIGHRV